MTRGTFVETSMEPNYESVQDYKDHLKIESPTYTDWTKLWDPDIECTCCGQEAPMEAAAMLKVEDQTPFTKKFGKTQVSPTGKLGETVWICADCYYNGVRPKYVYFGNIHWNKMGRRVKKRAENKRDHPW